MTFDVVQTAVAGRRGDPLTGKRHVLAIALLLLTFGGPLVVCAKERFEFSNNIGSATSRSDVVCLNIHNSRLMPGDRLLLVSPVSVQTVAEARVVKRAPDICRDTTDTDAGFERYEVRVVKGRLAPSMPAIAVHTAVRRLKRKGTSIIGDVNGDGQAEYFRSCGSAEGLHLTVWSGVPLQGTLRWRHYYYLGYDIKPTCTELEMPK